MKILPEEGYKRFFVIILYSIIGISLVYGLFRYIFPALLPFLIAFPAAAILRRPTLAIAGHTRMPRKIIASLLAILFVSLLLGGIAALVWMLTNEIGDFARSVISGETALMENLQNMLSRISGLIDRLPFSGGENADALRGAVTDMILDMAKNMISSLGARIPELAGKLVSALPQALIFFVVTVLSTVYFCADYDKILHFLRRHSGNHVRGTMVKIRAAAGATVSGILRSYAVLFLFTFAELLLGFILLGESYAFLLALLTALVDSLPVLGTGIVLLPMALYRFFIGETKAAIGFLILYIAVTVIRQILEPKILGNGVGMHPLLMLISMYIGFKLFSILGMLLLPILFIIAKNIIGVFLTPEKENTHAPP